MNSYNNRPNNRHRRRHQGAMKAVLISGLVFSSACAMTSSANSASTLAPETRQAMIDAIQDEYQARAMYQAVIEKFGPVRPFINIVDAEDRHAQRWVALFQQYGLPIPEDNFAGKVEAPESLQSACEIAIAGEIANVEMYDRFLGFVEELDLRATFEQLLDVSQNKHKPAFERCNSRIGTGRGRWR